jgi:hypothetical protein
MSCLFAEERVRRDWGTGAIRSPLPHVTPCWDFRPCSIWDLRPCLLGRWKDKVVEVPLYRSFPSTGLGDPPRVMGRHFLLASGRHNL